MARRSAIDHDASSPPLDRILSVHPVKGEQRWPYVMLIIERVATPYALLDVFEIDDSLEGGHDHYRCCRIHRDRAILHEVHFHFHTLMLRK